MKIFITGATGVVGRRVVPLLLAAGHQVTAVTRSPQKRVQMEQMGAAPVYVDLFTPEALRGAVAGHDVVVNLATHIPPIMQMFLPWVWAENDRIRRIASANLVDAALAGGAERFIQESFALVYPDSGDQWIDENTPIQVMRYNRTVADAEASAQRFTSSGRTGVVLRFAAFYGPGDEQVNTIIRAVKSGWVPIPGSADSFFSSVSHDDAASAVVAALGVPAGVYNVVDDEPLRRREYFDSLARLLGVRPPRLMPAWLAPFTGSLGETLARSLRISNRKLRAASGWAPKYPSMREGWQAVVEALPETT
jgi:nucleoside-diphosphate-sugar epimerase